MKFLTACLAVLLMATTAEAQRGGGGFHGGGGGFHGGGGGFHGGGGGFHGGGFHGGGFHGGVGGFNGGGFHGGGFRAGPGFHSGFNPAFRSGFGPGFHPGFNHGFRTFHGSSVVISPFFGFPFFTGVAPIVPFYSEPIYTSPTYITPSPTVTTSHATVADLNAQVQQLNNEVQQLQSGVAAANSQVPQTSAPPQNPPPITLILKDGRRIEAPGYALVGSTLWILNQDSATKIPLSDVDVGATQKENQQRGINVVIPSR